MARLRPSEVVVTGVRAIVTPPGAPLQPERWAGAPARLQRMDRFCALALVACDGALVDAALAPTAPEWNGERTGIVLGTAYGCHATNEDYYRGLLREGPAGASPRLFAYTLPSSPVGEISIHYGIRGPASALANGLGGGLDALGEAIALVASGRADRVVACAADVASPLLARLMPAEGLFATGELRDGAAALLLERAADAASRGATPRGRVLAVASAFTAGARAAALSSAIGAACAEAEIAPAAVAHLYAGGADAAIARARGVTVAPADAWQAGTLGAAALIAAARALAGADGGDALALVCAGDDGGSATAAILASG